MQENTAKTFSMSLLSLCLLPFLFQAKCSSPLAPALYIFGDSLTDSGNNNVLNTLAKVNYKPYGIDFPDGPTGRFTNGNTFVDFLAQFLGLPDVPPYLGLSVAQKSSTITGMNYASGSAGILRETGTALGNIVLVLN
ncbi:GDSL esterase/lipase 7-like [Telopea speciosissima]|uniref:GDSL esterase/lipase 7-like n=1 Tax=Telopea speciosissima TaxID=54955 RepID=UPI001CC371D7|nr:GDSL esterase/lipase 7-like [Telopea speciosissima]